MKEVTLNTVRKTSPNYKKYVALVDDEDFEKVSQHNWSTVKGRDALYAQAIINGKIVRMHTFITGYKISDHENHNGLDNQKHNLRDVTNQQNSMNRKSRENSTSQYKGVHWDKNAKKWRVTIRLSGKSIHLGCFLYEHNAAIVYNEAATKYHGKFAKLNILKDKGERLNDCVNL